ncbi:BrnT family toxin [candidate division KSB1 bacterium]|nr:BrnT family toxin [candidate division KSB1 bacterium]
MNNLRFEWDENKNRANQRKHKISFDEAKTVFYDENARLIPDPDHSENEERFIIMGVSSNLRMLVVVHCYKENNEVIRIISARKVTRNEQKYHNRRK